MGGERIHVERRGNGETRIVVDEYPEPEAAWCVSTSDGRGRLLTVVGWHGWDKTRAGTLSLHVGKRTPVMICGYTLESSLISRDKPEALGAMVGCAIEIALVLSERLGVGDGALEWELDHRSVDDIRTAFSDFNRRKPRRNDKRGSVYLRRESDAAGS